MTFTIRGRLESLNQTLKIPRHRFWQSQRRQRTKAMLGDWIQGSCVPRFAVPVRIHFHWVEKDRRRDYDNISAGAKLILDALKITERIVNDSQKWLAPPTHTFAIDKAEPRIEVSIQPATDPIPAWWTAPGKLEGSDA